MRHVMVASLLSLSLVAWAAPADVEALLQGVDEVVAPGALVGQVAVFGDDAFTVLTGAKGKSRLANIGAARYGAGRIVLGGHEGLFGNFDRPAQVALVTNIVRWLADGQAGARVLLHGHRGWRAPLEAAGFEVVQVDTGGLAAALPGAKVLLAAGAQLSAADQAPLIETIATWIQDGGGFFDAVPIWGWQQVTGRQDIAGYGANRVAARAGLSLGAGTVDGTGPNGWLADRVGLDLSHAQRALARLLAPEPLTADEQPQISAVLTEAAGTVPTDDTLLLPQLEAAIAGLGDTAVPTAQNPLALDQPLARLAVVLDHQAMRRAPIDQLQAHPAAATFPGAVAADVPSVEATILVDTKVPDWTSTGLYAAPGEVIEVTVPAAAAGSGLGVRIGAHTDTLWGLDRWQRFPEVTRATGLAQQVTRFGNPFGGPVYITVPRNSQLGVVPVEIKGAVEMPYFRAGVTPVDQWRARLRHLQAPWAELATDKIVLTVPASVVRDLDDPEALMMVWDTALDSLADLRTTSRLRDRPERIVSDQQISAGYMHSGYPIMTWLDVPPTMVDRDKLVDGGASTCWGFWHELGHNHQRGWWTFDGTGEVTVNLFSMYLCQRVSNEQVADNSWLNATRRNEAVTKYMAEGSDFDKWKSDPGLALMMYAQLQQAFGWGAFQRTFASYEAAAEGELPGNDDQKRDQWLVRFSRTVGRDLSPFFEAWGVPTSQAARDSLSDLAPWCPADVNLGLAFTREG
ncbi:MAG TPA: hypothetical protein DCZ72_10000 [Armatimonadetes bacterium]|nr:hypothetical protein [Armatimonadota bacterium]